MRARPAAATSGLVLVALFAAVASLHAYVLLGASWPSNSVGYRINANFPAGAPGTDAQVIEALRCGAMAWRQQAQSNILPSYLGTTAVTTVNSLDGVHACFWSPDDPGGGTLAITFTSSIGGNMVAFDMVFYASNDFGPITWNGVGDPSPVQTDLIAVATHEFGHVIGLDHPPIPAATMYAFYTDGDPGPRTLHSDDIAGAQFLYGFNPSIDPDPQIDDVDPPSGPASGGNTVTITGANFTWETDTVLRIGGVPLSSAFWELENCGKLVISSMPAHAAGSVSIEIENQLGDVTLSNAYIYGGLPPVLTSVLPAAGSTAGGNQVSLFGQNLAGDATVLFGSQLATGVIQVSAQELAVTAPPGPAGALVDIFLSQSSGSALLPDAYLYTDTALRIESTNATIGGSVVSRALATSGTPLAGFSCAVEFDGTFIDVTAVTGAGTASATAEFFTSDFSNSIIPGDNWWVCGVVMDFQGITTLPAGSDVPVVAASYQVAAFTPSGTLAVLDLVDGAGSPPTAVVFVPPGGVSITPTMIDGVLFAVVGGFVRGDANEDGVVDVADPVYTLSFLFSSGPGICLDAMDANDDGLVNIADAVYKLSFLFSGGPAPPAPYPGMGADPTADPLGC
jgi:hypothetical protein